MKILLTGKNGQLGTELRRSLLPFGELACLGRKEADMQDLAALRRAVRDQAPDIIVNAAAYTAVDKAETDEAAALQVNASAVALLADYAHSTRGLLVHYSSDYVFDGGKAGPYTETDAANPLSVYGRSKRLGEEAIMNSGCKALILRTSWVYSAQGGNFVKTVFRLARERDSLNIVADQIGAPTSAELLADVTALAIAAKRQGILPSGIYHLAASGETSWHELAVYIVRRLSGMGANLRLSAERIRPITTEEYPLPAKRPKNSRLHTGKLSAALGLQLPDWRIHLDRAMQQLIRTENQ
ncbi:dTDP-4-dehydrorhamnose reductase [Pollutimonas sp. M17]|uniref:dTDP-4-dehydrorhamnose reductase n=1 Tax=Pollutimonas sp. M17 TaxID=2962065 RepID=UPI0021F406D3|nr:dTDP-4-dehydrorhamnose reductase [Pollutimonas sp. M17]UYO94039.1 dTDP-4-dehydrorhamnose reductase [Pollutimonas sp. M17]